MTENEAGVSVPLGDTTTRSSSATGLALLCLLFFAPCLGAMPGCRQPSKPDGKSARKAEARPGSPADTVTVYALRYGESTYPSKFVFEHGTDERVPFAWYFWAIKDGAHTYLVDCGISDPQLVERWHIRGYTDPVVLLRAINVSPASITGIIITHMHADHFDGCRAFPDVPVYLQRDAFEAVRQAFTRAGAGRASRGYRRADFGFLQELRESGRLVLVNGSRSITRHIVVNPAPYHTRGMQEVTVRGSGKTVHLVADNVFVYENLALLRPIGTAVDRPGNLAYLERLRALDPDRHVIVPGHDPDVVRRFPTVADGVVELLAD